MKIGIDLGNYATKSSKGVNFISKVSKISNILNNGTTLTTEKGTFYLEEGEFDTEFRKVKKEYLTEMFLTALTLSSTDTSNLVVVGLPLSQYKRDKDELKNLLLKEKMHRIVIDGTEKRIIVEDLEVYPEGVAALVGTQFNGIIVDIGGRTTDISLLENNKIMLPYSLPIGTLNLYSDFIKSINSKYSLDLKSSDADRILRTGLQIYSEKRDINFAMDVFKSYVENIVNELQVSYSVKTLPIMLLGGGAMLMQKAFRNRLPNAELMENSIFANAQGFERRARQLWQ